MTGDGLSLGQRLGAALLRRAAERFELPVAEGYLPRLSRSRVYQVLTYHRVGDGGDGIFDPVPVAVFEMQMRHLAWHYNVLPLVELVERAEAGTLPERAVGISFDDGYEDNYTQAFPILRKYGLPATIFLAAGAIGTGRPLWHDRVFGAFALTGEAEATCLGERFHLTDGDERRRGAERCAFRLKAIEYGEREDAIVELLCRLKVSDADVRMRSPMLTWEQVRGMAGEGIDFGAHTMAHPILARLDAGRQREEIIGSIEAIEANLGKRPELFAYPNGRDGDFDETTMEILHHGGIRAAFTTRFGVNDGTGHPLRLNRGGAWGDDEGTFALKMPWYRMRRGEAS